MNEPTDARILIVDDHKSNVDLMGDVLAVHGYTIIKALDGRSALEIARTQPLDLILLDVNMPQMNGYQVIAELKADPKLESIPVIFVSANNDLQVKIDGFKGGGVDYITKPFQLGELQARVKTHVSLRKKQLEVDQLKQQEVVALQKISQLKDDMLRMVSHDIKSPLSNIMSCVRLLETLDGHILQAYPEMGEYVDIIQHSAEKILGVVREVLDSESVEAAADVQREEVALIPYLQEQVDDLQFSAEQNNIELSFASPPEDIGLMLSPARFSHVLQNLITNAIKYTPAGGRVEVSAEVLPTEVNIHVRDSGLGIPPEDVPFLFEKFYRVHNAEHQKRTGSGLGLAIVKTIAEQHGGRVWVESQLGKGSTFSVSLPRGIAMPVPETKS